MDHWISFANEDITPRHLLHCWSTFSLFNFTDSVCQSDSIGAQWCSFHWCWCENKQSVLLPWSSAVLMQNFCLISKSSQIISPFNKIRHLLIAHGRWLICSSTTPDFIPLSLRPPNGQHLNLVDYKLWEILQQWVYSLKIQNVDELQQRIIEEWECSDQCMIDNAVKQWHQCLRCGLAAKGGHFKHML